MVKLRIQLQLILATLFFLASTVSAGQANEDSLIATAICDEAKSRATAIKLFDYSNKLFAKYKKVKPRNEQISVGKMYEEDAEFHDATFDTFQATFILEPNGDKNLLTLSSKSAKFKLPWGLRFAQSMEQVRKILGPPSAINSNTLLYQITGEAISEVFFNFERNKLIEVNWSYGWAD
ncbi:hypothetical protein [Rugamonas rivuli]|uniref:Uncharacterized protein n=1 Tax=Rugamonas rivuli TaxID=2743358 RepID=A0A843SFY6_9BURK|nr:hypothetical protein [Rugamonas rivuli]MQA19356.1 hypothetical protein [Rugamonas rivuli]